MLILAPKLFNIFYNKSRVGLRHHVACTTVTICLNRWSRRILAQSTDKCYHSTCSMNLLTTTSSTLAALAQHSSTRSQVSDRSIRVSWRQPDSALSDFFRRPQMSVPKDDWLRVKRSEFLQSLSSFSRLSGIRRPCSWVQWTVLHSCSDHSSTAISKFYNKNLQYIITLSKIIS